ncbi:MAG: glycosyltransferase family 1 protein [Clostridium sp.]
MKKILVYGLTAVKGGVESFLMNYYRNFDLTKVSVDFISNTEEAAYEDEVLALGGNVYKVCSKRKNPFKFKKDLEEIFKETEYDVVWVNLCSLANIDYLKMAKKYGVKNIIVHSHNAGNMNGKLKEYFHNKNKKNIRKYANHFWSCSKLASEWFYDEDIIKSERFKVINNAIDTERFDYNVEVREKYRKEMDLENDLVLMNVGRFNIQKNHDFLIEIFNEVNKEVKNVKLLLVGVGELQEEIKNKVSSLGISKNIVFLNSRDDVNNLMQAADIFLMPSLFEGLPVSAVEAQASGIQCVLSDRITDEIKITDLIKFVDIDKEKSIERWKDKIISIKNIELENRSSKKLQVENAGFEIKLEAKKLEKFFLNEI